MTTTAKQLLGAAFGILSIAASAATLNYDLGKQIATLDDSAIDESSGLAASQSATNVFWTHNDSGGGPKLYAFGSDGKALATLHVSDASARDWEDMASVTIDKKPVLIIGDIGDNSARRKGATIYLLDEPTLHARSAVSITVKPTHTLPFSYEDGPHNCESIAVDPITKTLFLVSKRQAKTCKVYSLHWPEKPGKAAPQSAKAIATLTIPTTTAMDISPDGLRAIILTYGDAYEYTRKKGESWAEGFTNTARRIRMPLRMQGESICYGRDGRTLYLSSECPRTVGSIPSPLLEVPVQEP